MAGDRLYADRYRIVRRVGEGGMGVVFEAKDELLKKTVAIKTIRKGFIQPEHIIRFQQEAKALAALNHPNLVPLYVFGLTEDNEPYMVMRFERGTTLADMIRGRGRLPIIRALNIFIQITEAMQHAHTQGVLHRDLKPGNIMVGGPLDNPEVVVLDFGVAMLEAGDAIATLTKTGMIIGTPTYMSPEQVRGKDIDARSDIYSLGCIMYETLTGKPPFTAPTALELLSKKMTAEAPSLNQDGEEHSFPTAIAAIVATAISPHLNDRYQSMAELKEDLLAFKSGEYSIATSSEAASKAEVLVRHPNSDSHKLIVGGFIISVLLSVAVSLFLVSTLKTADNGSDVKKLSSAIESPKKFAKLAEKEVLPATYYPNQAKLVMFHVPDNDAVRREIQKYSKRPLYDLSFKESNVKLDDVFEGIEPVCRNLVSVRTDACLVSESWLEAVSRLPKLKLLSVRTTELTAKGLAHLQSSQTLKSLDLEECLLDKAALNEVLKLKRLTSLYLSRVQGVDDAYVNRIAKELNHLENLNFSNTYGDVTGACLSSLIKLPNLFGLNLNNIKLTDKDVELLSTFPNLRVLEIKGNQLSPKALRSIAKAKNLKTLVLTETGTQESDACLLKVFESSAVQVQLYKRVERSE